MKKTFLFSTLLCLAGLFSFVACDDKNDEETTLTVSPLTFNEVLGQGDTLSFTVDCNANWSITNNPEWISLTPPSGNGASTVSMIVKASTLTTSTRSATFTVTAGDKQENITVNQEEGPTSPEQVALVNQLVGTWQSTGYYVWPTANSLEYESNPHSMEVTKVDDYTIQITGLLGRGMSADIDKFIATVGIDNDGIGFITIPAGQELSSTIFTDTDKNVLGLYGGEFEEGDCPFAGRNLVIPIGQEGDNLVMAPGDNTAVTIEGEQVHLAFFVLAYRNSECVGGGARMAGVVWTKPLSSGASATGAAPAKKTKDASILFEEGAFVPAFQSLTK